MAAPAVDGASCGCLLVDTAYAVLQETEGWLHDKVQLRWMGKGRGCGIVAVGLIAEGTELLRTGACDGALLSSRRLGPGEEASFQSFLADSVRQEPDSGSDGSAQLVIRLTYLLLRLGRSLGKGSALERYVSALPEIDEAPELWPEEALAALRGSVIYPRVTDLAKQLRDEVASLAAHWPPDVLAPSPGLEELCPAYRRAKAIVASRGLTTDRGVVLCPVLDLVNHAGPDHALAKYSFAGGIMRLTASRDILPGSEVCMCYDRDADFLDIWERYGFFDRTAWIHTAEISVSPAAATSVQAGAYWVPEDSVTLACPLLSLLLAANQALVGTSSSKEEAESASLRSFAGLIRAHLAAYPGVTDEQGGLELAGDTCQRLVKLVVSKAAEADASGEGSLAQHVRAAGAVIAYEKQLLSGTLAKLERILSGAERDVE